MQQESLLSTDRCTKVRAQSYKTKVKWLNPAHEDYSMGGEEMEEESRDIHKIPEILESSCGLDVHEEMIEACILKAGEDTAYRNKHTGTVLLC